MTSNPYTTTIDSAASQYGIPPNLLAAQINQESGFNPNAVSSAGAQGIAQFMPATANSIGLKNPFSPTASINAAAKYDAQNYTEFGNWTQALEAYNQGPTATAQGTVYPGAQSYASNILSNAGMTTSGSVATNLQPGPTTYQPATSTTPLTIDISKTIPSSPCPNNDKPIFSAFGYALITPCGLWDLTVGIVGLVLIIAGFKASAPQALLAVAKSVT